VEAGVADGIIPEPEGGAQNDYALAGAAIRDALIAQLAEIDARHGKGAELDASALVAARFEKYRRIGVVANGSAQPD
jgi:acetyl-CoA carboxylase alpha subunit